MKMEERRGKNKNIFKCGPRGKGDVGAGGSATQN
jgi:hypothetical protein